MLAAKFDQPVPIAIGKPQRRRTVSSVSEAASCLTDDQWPAPKGPLTRIAASMMKVAGSGEITPSEAREAFIDAALEARVLDIEEAR